MRKLRFLLPLMLAVGVLALPVSGSATTPPGSISIANQAQLLTDGSVVLTVSYTCAPGPANDTTGTVVSIVEQGAINGSGSALATCDGRKHSAHLDNVPGPFSQGTAGAVAAVANTSSTSFAFTSRGVMVN
jgi:hypothetical protein